MLCANAIYLNGSIITVDGHDLLTIPLGEIKDVRPALMVAAGKVVYAAWASASWRPSRPR